MKLQVFRCGQATEIYARPPRQLIFPPLGGGVALRTPARNPSLQLSEEPMIFLAMPMK